MKKYLLALIATFFMVQANASVSTYIGADDNVSNVTDMVNSTAAAADFAAIAGPLNVVDFESAIPSDVVITGGSTVTNNCGPLCGFNTTSGGSFYRNLSGGSVTFSFTTAIDAFGFFVNGLQTNLVPQQTIEYVDGSFLTQIINMPSSIDGGGAFLGFIDFGQQISSVTFNATNDVLGFDDLLYGRSAQNPVPVPAALWLFGSGVIGLIGVKKKSSKLPSFLA